jgi:two-component system, response regulator PdtaR
MMKARRVLIIGDSALNAMLLAEILAEMGYGVCAIVATEAEAIAAALQHRPDIVIADVGLRSGSGIAAVEKMFRGGPVPYIFMSGGPIDVRIRLPDAIVIPSPAIKARSPNRASARRRRPILNDYGNIGTVNDTVVPAGSIGRCQPPIELACERPDDARAEAAP